MRIVACLVALLAMASPVRAQQGPPHAFLFGAWTGGLFPAAPQMTAALCLAHPTVIFTQDILLRATLTEFTYLQRQVETVRGNGANGVDFRFLPPTGKLGGSGLLGPVAPPAVGFGCESPDVLHVERRGDNEIAFPGCAEFPNPLVRCPAR